MGGKREKWCDWSWVGRPTTSIYISTVLRIVALQEKEMRKEMRKGMRAKRCAREDTAKKVQVQS